MKVKGALCFVFVAVFLQGTLSVAAGFFPTDRAIRNGIKHLPQLEAFKRVGEADVEGLVRYVEENEKEWKEKCREKEKAKTFYALPVDLPNFPKMTFEMAPGCKSLLVSYGKVIGKGGFKEVEKVLKYGSWKTFAEAKLLPENQDEAGKREIRSETRLLKKFAKLPNEKAAGIAKGYYGGQSRLVKKFYKDGDLIERIISGQFNKDFLQKLQVISSLSTGLANLHRLGLVHSDIKPENILLDGRSAVYDDFGFSYSPAKEIKKGMGKPCSGSETYVAPEHFDDWKGQSVSEKEENAKKGDVFSHAVIAYIVMNGGVPWNSCFDNKAFFDPKNYECKNKEVKILQEDLFRKNDPFSILLAQSLDEDTTKRPTAAQFQDKIDRLVKKEMIQKLNQSEKLVCEAGAKTVLAVLEKTKEKSYTLFVRKSRRFGDHRVAAIAFDPVKRKMSMREITADPSSLKEVEREISTLEKQGKLGKRVPCFALAR